MSCSNLSLHHTLCETYPVIHAIKSAVTDGGDGVIPIWVRYSGYTIGFSVYALPVFRFILLDNLLRINMLIL